MKLQDATLKVTQLLGNKRGLVIFFMVTIAVFVMNRNQFLASGLVHKSPTQILSTLGTADSGSYLRLAIDLANFNVTAENYWIVGLWPPGMPILDAVAILLPGSFYVWTMLFSSYIASLPIVYLAQTVTTKAQACLLTIISMIYIFEPNRFWSLTEGLLNSDGIGSALLAAAIVLGFQIIRDLHAKPIFKNAILAGIFLGLSLHFRWAYLPIVAACLVVFAALLLIQTVRTRLLKSTSGRAIKVIAIFASALLVTLSPWTIFVSTVLHPNNISWSTGEYQWGQRWMSDGFLIRGQATWLVEGGANWGCKIDIKTCQRLQPKIEKGHVTDYKEFREEAIAAAISKPIDLLIFKTPIVYKGITSRAGESVESNSNSLLGNLLLVLVAISLGMLAIFRQPTLLAFYLGTSILFFSALYAAHVESRYLLPFWDFTVLLLFFYTIRIAISRFQTTIRNNPNEID